MNAVHLSLFAVAAVFGVAWVVSLVAHWRLARRVDANVSAWGTIRAMEKRIEYFEVNEGLIDPEDTGHPRLVATKDDIQEMKSEFATVNGLAAAWDAIKTNIGEVKKELKRLDETKSNRRAHKKAAKKPKARQGDTP